MSWLLWAAGIGGAVAWWRGQQPVDWWSNTLTGAVVFHRGITAPPLGNAADWRPASEDEIAWARNLLDLGIDPPANDSPVPEWRVTHGRL